MKTMERMEQGWAVFNCHRNDAKERADAEFIAQFGQEIFDEVMAPLHKDGIMAIFHDDPTPETAAWVALCTAYVNEDRNEAIIPPDPNLDAVARGLAEADNWDWDALPEVDDADVDRQQYRFRAKAAIDKWSEVTA